MNTVCRPASSLPNKYLRLRHNITASTRQFTSWNGIRHINICLASIFQDNTAPSASSASSLVALHRQPFRWSTRYDVFHLHFTNVFSLHKSISFLIGCQATCLVASMFVCCCYSPVAPLTKPHVHFPSDSFHRSITHWDYFTFNALLLSHFLLKLSSLSHIF
jgi:hypothetical protein